MKGGETGERKKRRRGNGRKKMSNRRLEKTLNGNYRKEVKDITIQENIQKL